MPFQRRTRAFCGCGAQLRKLPFPLRTLCTLPSTAVERSGVSASCRACCSTPAACVHTTQAMNSNLQGRGRMATVNGLPRPGLHGAHAGRTQRMRGRDRPQGCATCAHASCSWSLHVPLATVHAYNARPQARGGRAQDAAGAAWPCARSLLASMNASAVRAPLVRGQPAKAAGPSCTYRASQHRHVLQAAEQSQCAALRALRWLGAARWRSNPVRGVVQNDCAR